MGDGGRPRLVLVVGEGAVSSEKEMQQLRLWLQLRQLWQLLSLATLATKTRIRSYP